MLHTDETFQATCHWCRQTLSLTHQAARLILLGLAAVVLAFFVYRAAGTAVRDNPAPLAWLVVLSFVLLFIAELMGRSLHYDSMMRVGM